MRYKATPVILTALIIATVTFTASAQIPLNMNYQARLADSTGNPVPDGPYDLEFNFYSDSTGGFPVWTEQFFGVSTSNGFFDVFLEMDPENLDGPLFMEVTVDGEILSPRSRMASVPYSAISQRVQGDIQTGEGFIRMSIPPDPIHPVAEIMSDGTANITTFKLSVPPDPVSPAIEMTADASLNMSKFRLSMPPDDQIPWAEIISDGANQTGRIKLVIPPNDIMPAIDMMTSIPTEQTTFKLGMPPDDIVPAIEMMRDANANITNFKLMIPPDDIRPAIGMTADGISNITSFKLTIPPDDQTPAFEVEADGATDQTKIKLGLPPDDIMPAFEVMTNGSNISKIKLGLPPDDQTPVIEMATDGSYRVANIKMSIPPNDQHPVAEIKADNMLNRASFKMAVPPDDIMPGIEMVTDAAANLTSFKLATPPDDQMPSIEMTTNGVTNQTRIKLSIPPDDIRPAMELGVNENNSIFQMAAPQGVSPGEDISDPMFEITADSTGVAASWFDDVGKYMGIEPSPFMPGGFVYMIDPSAGDTVMSLGSDGRIWAADGITLGPNLNSGTGNFIAGAGNTVNGSYNIICGYGSQSDYDDVFIWSDYAVGPSVIPVQSSGNNQFLVRATGGVAFYTNSSLNSGVTLGPGDNTWNSIVPPLTADNSSEVDGSEILNKMRQLPVKRFSSDGENHHISPSPEDFNSLFDSGDAEDQISMQDQAGIALAGIKEMVNIINDLKDKNAELERRIAELERTR